MNTFKEWSPLFSIILAETQEASISHETIESIIQQDLGFEENIQLILLRNNDNCLVDEVSQQYATQFPRNVIVVKKEYENVLEAWNVGIEIATGTLVSFVDADARFSLNAFSEVKLFLEKNAATTSVVAIRLAHDNQDCKAYLRNEQFEDGTRLIDLLKEPNRVQTCCASTFIERKIIGETRFLPSLAYGGECYFIQQLFLKFPRLGVVASAEYFCPKRKTDLAMVRANKESHDFLYIPRDFYLPLLEQAAQRFKKLPRFIRYAMTYNFQWILREFSTISNNTLWTRDEIEVFRKTIQKVIKEADDKLILRSKNLFFEHRIFYFSEKFDLLPQVEDCDGNTIINFDHRQVFNHPPLQFRSLEAYGTSMRLVVEVVQCGRCPSIEEMFVECDGHKVHAKLLSTKITTTFIDEPLCYFHTFELEIPLMDSPSLAKVSLLLIQGGQQLVAKHVTFHDNFPLKGQDDFCVLNGVKVRIENGIFVLERLIECCDKEVLQPNFSVIVADTADVPVTVETVNSIIQQTLDFNKNIQLIWLTNREAPLVDLGETNDSLWREYVVAYPKNIVVIKADYSDVLSAWNRGIVATTGRFVTFVDADGYFSLDTFAKVRAFGEANIKKMNVIAIPLAHTDLQDKSYLRNEQFSNGTRIIKLSSRPTLVQTCCVSTFINREAIKENRFIPGFTWGGEGYFMSQLLLKKPRLGVVADALYFFPSRKTDISVIRANRDSSNFVLDLCRFYLLRLQQIQFKGQVIPRFIRCLIAYYTQWLLRELPKIPQAHSFNDEEKEVVRSEIAQLFNAADDAFILQSKNLFLEDRLIYFCQKYGQPQLKRVVQEAFFTFNKQKEMFSYPYVQWHSLYAKARSVYLVVSFVQFKDVPKVADVFAKCGNEKFMARHIVTKPGATFLNEPKYYRCLFEIRLPLDQLPKTAKITIHFIQGGASFLATSPSFHRHFPISSRYENAFCVLNGVKVTMEKNVLVIMQKFSHLRSEWKLISEIIRKKEDFWKSSVFIRVLRFIRLKLKCKPIWLLKDRPIAADDNGEVMFRYLRKSCHQIKSYFLINKDASAYQTLQKVGPVVAFDTIKCRILNGLAEAILSSQTHMPSWNIMNHALRDIFALQPFIFLQHGITQNDGSNWWGKFNMNLFGFVTAAHPEYDFILDGGYGYSRQNVWLTGFPRFDRLYHDERRQITIMPTWRRWLFERLDPQTGVWIPIANIEESEYCKFWNALINDSQLINVAKEHGYTLVFFPHPMIRLNNLMEKFNCEHVTVLPIETSYCDLYAQSDLIITDYSSSVFDFSYLRKPIVYAQFDKDEFFSGRHTVEIGYFDAERDGHGEVTYTLEDTVQILVEYMRTGCNLKDKYRERIDQFFAFSDQNNCARVYEHVRAFLPTRQIYSCKDTD